MDLQRTGYLQRRGAHDIVPLVSFQRGGPDPSRLGLVRSQFSCHASCPRACKSWGGRFCQAGVAYDMVARSVLFVGRCRLANAAPMDSP